MGKKVGMNTHNAILQKLCDGVLLFPLPLLTADNRQPEELCTSSQTAHLHPSMGKGFWVTSQSPVVILPQLSAETFPAPKELPGRESSRVLPVSAA